MGTLSHSHLTAVIEKAWADAQFKARLLSEPRAVLAEQGIPTDEAVSVEILEDTDHLSHLVIPQNTPVNHRLVEHRHFPRWVFYADCDEHRDVIGKVVEQAWSAPDFLDRLVRSPKEVLAEFGLACSGKDIKVHANSDRAWYVVLPTPAEV